MEDNYINSWRLLSLWRRVRHLGSRGAGSSAGGTVALGAQDLACPFRISKLRDKKVELCAVSALYRTEDQVAVVKLRHGGPKSKAGMQKARDR